MANPLISLGQLNRLRASTILPNFPELNVTASYLTEEGISLRLNGPVTTRIQAMTGSVPSPEPYVPVVVTVNLIKSQPLSALYKAQIESLSLVGDMTVKPDVEPGVGGISPYFLTNCSIDDVSEVSFNGRTAGWTVVIGGNWIVNNQVWN